MLGVPSFSFFGLFDIAYYGVIVATSIIVAFVVGLFLLKKANYKEDIAYLIILICVPLGFIFARLYYITFDGWGNYKSFMDVIAVWNGGIAIYGGVIGAAIGLLIITKAIKKCGFFTVADIGVICLIIAQVIGRWGNFVNDEAYGLCVSSSLVIPFVVPGNDCVECGGLQNHVGTFFIESMLNLAGFFFLLWILLKKQKKWGVTTACYLIWYGVVRAIIEPLRMDSLTIGSSTMIFARVSFLLSLALIIMGVLLLWAVKRGWISQENSKCLKTNETDTKKPK
jgi:phosphatidylglycerol:prolipoprotein diacylglycerol transferase